MRCVYACVCPLTRFLESGRLSASLQFISVCVSATSQLSRKHNFAWKLVISHNCGDSQQGTLHGRTGANMAWVFRNIFSLWDIESLGWLPSQGLCTYFPSAWHPLPRSLFGFPSPKKCLTQMTFSPGSLYCPHQSVPLSTWAPFSYNSFNFPSSMCQYLQIKYVGLSVVCLLSWNVSSMSQGFTLSFEGLDSGLTQHRCSVCIWEWIPCSQQASPSAPAWLCPAHLSWAWHQQNVPRVKGP